MKKDNKRTSEDFSDIKKLAEEADNNKGFELGFEDDFVEDISQLDFIDDKQNPKESYRLYYTIESILRDHLPKGDKYEELRKTVREEKIIFLTGKRKNENGIRGADSRQAYISSHLKVALNAIFEWLSEGGNSFDLFLKFRKLNIEKGYFKEDELSEFNQKLKGLGYNPKDNN
jgi:hypothetical protein